MTLSCTVRPALGIHPDTVCIHTRVSVCSVVQVSNQLFVNDYQTPRLLVHVNLHVFRLRTYYRAPDLQFGLQDMGFSDRPANVRALQAVSGNVNAAVERLLSGV